MKFKSEIATVLALLTMAVYPALAQEITLTSKTGGLTVNGKLLAFDGQTYQVETDLGRITISDNDLNCQGQGCPSAEDRVDVFSLIPTDRISRQTLADLVLSYAKNTKKIAKQKGPFLKPDTIELSHRTEGLESIISFKSDVINLRFSAKGAGTPAAFDAVQIISSAPELSAGMDTQTLRKIWTGEISNWNQLGGADQAIRLILPIFADDIYNSFVAFDPNMTAENITQNVEFFLSPDAIKQAIKQTPNAIGLIYQSHPVEHTIALDMGCEISAMPSEIAIQSLEYPLAFPLTLNSNNAYAPRTARNLQKFAQTPTAQELFATAGLTPLLGTPIDGLYLGKRYGDAIAAADSDVGLNALKAFKTFTKTATRLATTLYFAPNGRDLDNRSTAMLDALSAHLSTDTYANKTVLAVGFSDSLGGANANQSISLTRARLVQSMLSTQNITTDAIGFGEIAPIGCNETEYGRSKNRRVEIWVRN